MEVKKATTFEEQLEIMKRRGCIVEDEKKALQVLKCVNYYRLTAYFLPYKMPDDRYREGTTFEKIYRIYDFDRRLRNLLLMIIERIELYFRAQIAYYHAHRYGPLGYLNEENYNKRHHHDRFIAHIEEAVKNNAQQPFVAHYIQQYDAQFPIWVIVELLTVGELSTFYDDLPRADKKTLARNCLQTTDRNLTSWLICLTKLRNYCAHYSRLYFNKFGTVPATPLGFSYRLGDRVFDYILVLKFLYPEKSAWEKDCCEPFERLLEEYSDAIDLAHLGMPQNYSELLN